MEWIDPQKQLPPQGKKILYFKSGDIYVVQRFGKYWLPIPFSDSKYAFHEEPDFWADITPPNGYTGLMQLLIHDVFYCIDDVEIHHEDIYTSFIHDVYMSFINDKKTFAELSDDR